MTGDDGNGESFSYEVTGDESLSEGVVEAVASETGVDAAPSTDPGTEGSLAPLYTVVDPDALDSVFCGGDGTDGVHGEIRFHYHGYEVSVRSEGLIDLTPAETTGGVASD